MNCLDSLENCEIFCIPSIGFSFDQYALILTTDTVVGHIFSLKSPNFTQNDSYWKIKIDHLSEFLL